MRFFFQRLLPVLLLIFTIQLGEVTASAQTSMTDSTVTLQSDTLVKESPQQKSPGGAVLRSLLVPGWGQFYNGQKIKAAIVCAGEVALIGTAVYWDRQASNAPDDQTGFVYRDYRNQALWFLAGTIVLSMLDAYVDAQLADFDEDPSLALDPKLNMLSKRCNMVFGIRLRL